MQATNPAAGEILGDSRETAGRQSRLLALRCVRLHSDIMAKSITIRDVPDETSAELAARAALTGRSLQEYLRARLVELANSPDSEVWLSRVRARKAATGGSISADRILAHRDADRR